MRFRILAAFLIGLGLLSCSDTPETNSILVANIKDLNKGTVYLERLQDSSLIRLDSVLVDGQSPLTLGANLDSPEVLYVHVLVDASELIDTRIPIFMESGTVELYTRLNNLQGAAVIKGSANHEKWQEYKQSMSRFTDRNLELIKALIESGKNENDSLTAAIEAQQVQLVRSKYLATINFAKNNTAYAVSPYVVLNEVRVAKNTYLDTVYNALQDSVKTGTYGKELFALINQQQEAAGDQ